MPVKLLLREKNYRVSNDPKRMRSGFVYQWGKKIIEMLSDDAAPPPPERRGAPKKKSFITKMTQERHNYAVVNVQKAADGRL